MKKIIISILIVGLMVLRLAYAERAERSQFKGVELYSFTTEENNTIQYALVPGTNTLKQIDFLIKNAISYEELIDKIKNLAPQENIFWGNTLSQKNNNETVTFKYPDENTMEEIMSICKKLNISLHISYENK